MFHVGIDWVLHFDVIESCEVNVDIWMQGTWNMFEKFMMQGKFFEKSLVNVYYVSPAHLWVGWLTYHQLCHMDPPPQ